jgi:hypothetical protein
MFQKIRHEISNVILKIISNFKNVEAFLEQINYSSLRNKIETMISKYFQKQQSNILI